MSIDDKEIRIRLRIRKLGRNQMRGRYNYFVKVQKGNALLAQSFSIVLRRFRNKFLSTIVIYT